MAATNDQTHRRNRDPRDMRKLCILNPLNLVKISMNFERFIDRLDNYFTLNGTQAVAHSRLHFTTPKSK